MNLYNNLNFDPRNINTDLWTSTVTDLIPLPDSITTDWVSHRHRGLIEQTPVQVTSSEATAEVTATTVTPLCGGGKPRHRRHDTVARWIVANTVPCNG